MDFLMSYLQKSMRGTHEKEQYFLEEGYKKLKYKIMNSNTKAERMRKNT